MIQVLRCKVFVLPVALPPFYVFVTSLTRQDKTLILCLVGASTTIFLQEQPKVFACFRFLFITQAITLKNTRWLKTHRVGIQFSFGVVNQPIKVVYQVM